jgi:hypothetical protein
MRRGNQTFSLTTKTLRCKNVGYRFPKNIWHQPVVSPDNDWVVVSFHTVPAEELIEERPDPSRDSGTRQMHYVARRSIPLGHNDKACKIV